MFQKVSALAGKCPVCGHTHTLNTTEVYIGPGESAHLVEWIRQSGRRTCVVADENTYRCGQSLSQAAGCSLLILPGNAHADENTTAMLASMPSFGKAEQYVACGSGSLHDTVRYTAAKARKPFVSYPTAASVDGFVSGVAAMTWHGQKLTFPSVSPIAVFADDDVYAAAPARLTASGAGDILGKYTALFDWRAAQILTGEHVCERIFSLEEEALSRCADTIRRRASLTPQAYAHEIMEGLILSGLAMQLQGNSRPASGAEHHLSHLWEMHVVNPVTHALHGEQVGVGLLIVLGIYERFAARATLLTEEFLHPDLDRVLDRTYLAPAFGALTDGILGENQPDGRGSFSLSKYTVADREAAERALREALSALPTRAEAKTLLELAGAPTDTAALGLPQDVDFDARTAEFAPYVRNRFTLLKGIAAEARTRGK